MGCAPILLVGVENYTGKAYTDDPDARSTGFNLKSGEHMKRWARLKFFAPGGHFRAVSGPLLELFPRYNPKEVQFAPYSEEYVRKVAQGVFVQFGKEEIIGRRRYCRGEIEEVTALEAHTLVRKGAAVRVKSGAKHV